MRREQGRISIIKRRGNEEVNKLKVIAIVGARPQFIKHFPFEKSLSSDTELITIHTGQHYDDYMSKVFFDQMNMSRPKYMLQIGSRGHGAQTGMMMEEIEKIVLDEKPDWMVVYGDTNSTLAGALVAAKLHVPIAHIEAGLRSFNKEMPEEVNRVLTDHISDLLLVPSDVAVQNLAKEGIRNNVHAVGDIMKDLVIYSIDNNHITARKQQGEYYYATIHRPYNTDEKERLMYILDSLSQADKTVMFSIHPRTINAMSKFGLLRDNYPNIVFIDPQGYFDNLSYLYFSSGLITDSGGMQKEAYWLKKKCITIRTETEWIETLVDSANTLVFNDLSGLNDIMAMPAKWNNHLYGDGNCGALISSLLLENSMKRN